MMNTQLSGRDTAIDVIRALALLTIFVNHVPGNPLEFLTHKNFGFSDAAEAFVLISGVSAGLAYGPKFLSGQRLLTTLKAWRRAGVLYVAQLGTTIATIAIFAFIALHLEAPGLLKEINIGPVMEQTGEAMIGIVTLGHQLGYNNILSMYAGILLLVPPLLLLGAISLRLMVIVSAALWFLAGLLQIAPGTYPLPGTWFLNPLSWQFLFIIGMAATMHVRRGGEIRAARIPVFLCATYLTGALIWVRLDAWGIEKAIDLPVVLAGFDKTYLSLPRLAHVLAIAYLIVVTPTLVRALRLPRTNPLVVIGMHSLPVFVCGTVLAMAAQAWRLANGTTIPGDIAILTAGISFQLALAYYLEWYAGFKKGTMARPARIPVSAGYPERLDMGQLATVRSRARVTL